MNGRYEVQVRVWENSDDDKPLWKTMGREDDGERALEIFIQQRQATNAHSVRIIDTFCLPPHSPRVTSNHGVYVISKGNWVTGESIPVPRPMDEPISGVPGDSFGITHCELCGQLHFRINGVWSCPTWPPPAPTETNP